MNIYKFVANLYPKKAQIYLGKLLKSAGDNSPLEYWLGSYTLFSVLVGFAVFISSWTIYGYLDIYYLLIGLTVSLLIMFFVLIVIFLKFEDRIARIDEVVPDMLMLVASNLNSGLTPYQALNVSARPEFGPLAEEIKVVVKKSHGTESFTDLLLRMTDNIKSESLDRVIKMFSSAIRAGGKLAQLLEDIATDISATKVLKDELVTTTKTYTTFILFTIIIGSPLLLGISIHFITLVADLQTTSSNNVGFGLDFLAGGLTITPEYLTTVSIIMLIITSFLTASLLGVIKEGNEIYGLRYAPLLLTGTLTTFFIVRYVIGAFFAV